MTLKNKRFTIYPPIEKLEKDKADDIFDFILLKIKPYIDEYGENFVKDFKIIKNAAPDDESIYCDITFDVDELLAVNDAYIELEIKDLVNFSVKRSPVPELDIISSDKNLVTYVESCLREKIFDFVRTLKPDCMFWNDNGELN